MKPLQNHLPASSEGLGTAPSQPAIITSNPDMQQLLSQWFILSTICAQRVLLETYPMLLELLSLQLISQQEDTEVRKTQKLLQDASARGGTASAIRAAYVNAYGGFVLDLPSWLVLVVQQLAVLQDSKRAYETANARVELLRAALDSVSSNVQVAVETVATLQHEFAIACLELLGADRSQHVESAIKFCETALQRYTFADYPGQYALVQITLADGYRERIVGIQRENREVAIAYYQNALRVFTQQDDPLGYTQAQYGLGQALQLRIKGNPQDNLERAIAHCRQALQVYTLEALPLDYARTLLVLGKAYLQRVMGERRDNLEQAITYYREAAALLTPDLAPVEYALSQHSLATAFSQRIAGERRDNLEQAITYYHQSLRIYTIETFPVEYARVQNNLGIVYWQRTTGERSDNIEHSIACYRQAAHIFTLATFPYQYAMLQNNLGVAYVVRVAGKRSENLEQAIACYHAALQVWTLEAFPLQYGKLQNNLGEVYQLRLAGEPSANQEHAIDYYHEALRIFTPQTLPVEYAMTQQNLGAVYKSRLKGTCEENLDHVLTCYHNALTIYTLHAFPSEHRQLQIDRAEALALRADWAAVHDAYVLAHQAEDLLIALSTGTLGLDAILKEGRDATVRDGFALVRLGRVVEAAVTIERGRARGLAQAMEINSADPSHISDAARRARYTSAHHEFIEAQATLHAPLPQEQDDHEQRRIMVQRTAHYRDTKAVFDASVEEIRAAQDPPDFLTHVLDAKTIVRTVADCGQGHALVYLATTPWGGMAVAVLPHLEQTPDSPLFAALELPFLTDELVDSLVETRLDIDSSACVGGLYCAQSGHAFDMLQGFSGDTFHAKAASLHESCVAAKKSAALDSAAQFILSLPSLSALVDHPLSSLSANSCTLLSETLCYTVLHHELQRCQTLLGENVIMPLADWLLALSVTDLTFVPCGPLALLPLGGILLQDGRMFSSVLPLSIAPSTRSLQQGKRDVTSHEGVYALGNPYPTQQELRWSEAEALTLARLGDQMAQTVGVKVQWQATRAWLIDVLRKGYVVDASCHGLFDAHDFLRSRLFLAETETLTLADMLALQAHLRGMRLLILSACQTAIIDLRGAHEELHSLASAMLQAGAAAILATLWAVDDRATYLLIVRFAQEWFPHLYDEPPAVALVKAQQWLRTVTNRELQQWQAFVPILSQSKQQDSNELLPNEMFEPQQLLHTEEYLLAVRGRGNRFDAARAQELVQDSAEMQDAPDSIPFSDPYYWAGFQIIGW